MTEKMPVSNCMFEQVCRFCEIKCWMFSAGYYLIEDFARRGSMES